MKNSSIKSRILVLIGALAIITVSLSFTFSDATTSGSNHAQTETIEAQPVGGFVQDPK